MFRCVKIVGMKFCSAALRPNESICRCCECQQDVLPFTVVCLTIRSISSTNCGSQGYPCDENCTVFWGTSRRPDLIRTMQSVIMVCPRMLSSFACLEPMMSNGGLHATLLTAHEMAAGYAFKSDDLDLHQQDCLILHAGMVVSKISPQQNDTRRPQPYAVTRQSMLELAPQHSQDPGDKRCLHDAAISGYVDVNGGFHVLNSSQRGGLNGLPVKSCRRQRVFGRRWMVDSCP